MEGVFLRTGQVARDWEEVVAQLGGLLLDFDEGTLSVYKNDRRLGGVIKGGLNGEYCWFVTVASHCTFSMSRGRAPN